MADELKRRFPLCNSYFAWISTENCADHNVSWRGSKCSHVTSIICTSPVPVCPDYMEAFAVSLHGIRKQNTCSSGCNRSTGKAASATASSSAASRSTHQCKVWWDCPAAPSNPHPSFREGPILFLIEPLGALVTGFQRRQWFGLDSLEVKKASSIWKVDWSLKWKGKWQLLK